MDDTNHPKTEASQKPPIPKKPESLVSTSGKTKDDKSSEYPDIVIEAEVYSPDDKVSDDDSVEQANDSASMEKEPTSPGVDSVSDFDKLSEIELEEPEYTKNNDNNHENKEMISDEGKNGHSKKPEVDKHNLGLENGDARKQFDSRVSITIDDSVLLKPVGFYRFGIAILTLSSILLANMNRQAFNQALSEMIDPKNPKSWTSEQSSDLKSAFSMGYAIFMIPSARMGEIFGTKWIVFASTFGSGLCSTLVPYLADNDHYTFTYISRFLMGVCQAGVAPALYAILARWLSVEESNKFIPLIKGGVSFGLLLGAGSVGLFSWRATFYICGGIALGFAALWVFYVTSLPEQNKFLSLDELRYIQQQMRIRDGIKKKRAESLKPPEVQAAPKTISEQQQPVGAQSTIDQFMNHRYVKLVVDELKLWKIIFFNIPVIGVCLVKWTMRLSTDAQTQYLADFFKQVHRLSKEENSYVNCANYALQGVLTFHIVWLSNELTSKKPYGMTKPIVRRLFQCGCSFGMAAAYLLITFDLTSLNVSLWAVILLALTNIMQSGADSILPYDLSPTYSATIMGVANSFANSAGVILPKIHKAFVGNDVYNLNKWAVFFYTVGGLIASGGVIFILMVKAQVQQFDPAYPQDRLNVLREKQERLKIKNAKIDIEMLRYEPRKESIKHDKPIEQIELQSRQENNVQKPKMSQLTFQEWRASKHAKLGSS